MPQIERLTQVRAILATGRVVRASEICEAMKISERSAYRYINALRKLGDEIRGEAGVGFLMKRSK